MTEIVFTPEEITILRDSLLYTKRAFIEYEYYPNLEFKLKRIKEVDDLLDKLLEYKRSQ